MNATDFDRFSQESESDNAGRMGMFVLFAVVIAGWLNVAAWAL